MPLSINSVMLSMRFFTFIIKVKNHILIVIKQS